MIQSSYKPIELPKAAAPERKPSSKNDKPRDLESRLEKEDFESELKAVSESHEPKVKAVKVSADKELRKPSSLINENTETTHPDAVSPKVFDPSMTKDVESLVAPKTTEAEVEMTNEMILKLAQGEEVTDADLAAELTKKTGRSPSIDFAEAEVDPELMKLEDFVAQKNLVNKKLVTQNAYGMNPQANKLALENGLKNTQIVQDATATTEGTGSSQPMNSQQFILNMMSEQKNVSPNEVQSPVKTFDMSQIKTADGDKIMNQITDYIVQAKAAKEPTVFMKVNHAELGMIDITVSRTGTADAIAINIGAHSMDGKNFFQQNSKDLLAHLTTAGLSVADMKVEIPSQTAKNDFDMSQHNKGQQGTDKQFGSEQNQRRHDSQRREDLWKLLNKEAA